MDTIVLGYHGSDATKCALARAADLAEALSVAEHDARSAAFEVLVFCEQPGDCLQMHRRGT